MVSGASGSVHGPETKYVKVWVHQMTSKECKTIQTHCGKNAIWEILES